MHSIKMDPYMRSSKTDGYMVWFIQLWSAQHSSKTDGYVAIVHLVMVRMVMVYIAL